MFESPGETRARAIENGLRRMNDVVFIVTISKDDRLKYESLILGSHKGIFRTRGSQFEGYLMAITPMINNQHEVRIRPTGAVVGQVDMSTVIYLHPESAQDLETFQQRYGPQPQFKKEDSMKLYEVVIVRLNDKGEVEDSMFDQPELVTARSASEAREQVLVDFAADQGLTGKDLSGYRVGTREFLLQA